MTTPCPSCGYENRSSAHRCGLCGKPFVAAAGAAALASQTVSARRDPVDGGIIPVRRDFAAEIESNKTKSVFLLVICLLLLTAVGWAFAVLFMPAEFESSSVLGALIGLIIGIMVSIWAFTKGDRSILELSQAEPSDKIADRQIVNLVDEMRIAAGLPMPKVYIIETDAANAFATGRDPEHATVTVTTGLMKTLNREELQGVVAHEMSHIRNYDIRYMMLVAALVGAIVLISDIGGRGLWWGGGRRRGSREGGGHPAFALLAIVLIILAPIFASLLQMAVSRKREFLADASAVELTRNPLGLASALEKIDNRIDDEPLPGASKATQHLYIANPLRHFGMRSRALFSTHPPMEARIKILKAMG